MSSLAKKYLVIIDIYRSKAITRLDGMICKQLDVDIRKRNQDLLYSGYTLHLDLQNLSKEEKRAVWKQLTEDTTLTHLAKNPFNYRGTEDQFGQLHEEYFTSWLDISGNLWAYFSNYWHQQAFITDDNAFYVFKTRDHPDLIMLKYIGDHKTTLSPKPKHTLNVVSTQFFKKKIQSLSNNSSSQSADAYHKTALQLDHLFKLKQSSIAVILSLLIWFLFQYPPSSTFFIGLLASIGIPFFPINLALLGTLSLISIFVAIGINYFCDLLTTKGQHIVELQTLNKILYQIALFVFPIILAASTLFVCFQVNLLLLSFIALAFALYHYLCLNDSFLSHKDRAASSMSSLFKGPMGHAQNPTHDSEHIELQEFKKPA